MSLIDTLVYSEYKFLNELNHGRSSIVYRAIHNASKQEVAIKIISRKTITAKELSMEIIQNEKKIFDYLAINVPIGSYSKHVIEYRGHYSTDEKDYFVMELLDGYDLLREVHERFHSANRKLIPLEEKKDIMLQIITGLKFLHSLGVYHGDLKPENVVISKNNRVVIVDFGCAVVNMENKCVAKELFRKGTPGFCPPEIIDVSVLDRIVSLDKVDVWALCGCFYYLFEGKLPFRDTNYNDARFTENVCGLMYDKNASKDVLRICENVFVIEQADRLSLEEFENEIKKLE